MGFLNKVPDVLGKIRDSVATSIKQVQQKAMKRELTTGTYSPREVLDGDIISSQEYNAEMRTLYLALIGLYNEVIALNNLRKQHDQVLDELFTKCKAALLKLYNDIRVNSILITREDVDEIKLVDFNTSRNLADKLPAAMVDNNARVLTLSPVDVGNISFIIPTSGKPSITVTHLGGKSSNAIAQEMALSNIVDADPGTFWGDIVISDGPIRVVYSLSNGEPRTCFGLVTEIVLDMPEIEKINKLAILPFCSDPVYIIDAAYKSNINDIEWKRVPDFEEVFTFNDWVTFRFFPIDAAIIKITTLQENFRGINLSVPTKTVDSTNIIEHISAQDWADSFGTGFDANDTSAIQLIPSLASYFEAAQTLHNRLVSSSLPSGKVNDAKLIEEMFSNIVNLLSTSNDWRAALSKPEEIEWSSDNLRLVAIEYGIGIKSIEASYERYKATSYFASPRFIPSATPIEISIVSKERHPTIPVSVGVDRLTGIEYSIALGDGFTVPIVPTNAPVVYDELLIINPSTLIGYTRILPNSVSCTLRCDGLILSASAYSFTIDTGNDRGVISLEQGYFVNNGIYTITYVPDPDSQFVQPNALVVPSILFQPEVFKGTKSGNTVSVEYIPHISRAIINGDRFSRESGTGIWQYLPLTSLDTTTIDGVTYSINNLVYEPIIVYVDGIKAKNITVYDGQAQPAFTRTSKDSNEIQYIHVGKTFFFNKQIASEIRITYRWLTQYIQVMATLRCLRPQVTDITPIISEIQTNITVASR